MCRRQTVNRLCFGQVVCCGHVGVDRDYEGLRVFCVGFSGFLSYGGLVGGVSLFSLDFLHLGVSKNSGENHQNGW